MNFEIHSDEHDKRIVTPDTAKVTALMVHMQGLLDIIIKQVDNFQGDTALTTEEKVGKCDRILYEWLQLRNKIASRHESAKSKEGNMNLEQLHIVSVLISSASY